jgi:hypothetical protein
VKTGAGISAPYGQNAESPGEKNDSFSGKNTCFLRARPAQAKKLAKPPSKIPFKTTKAAAIIRPVNG